MNNLDMDKVKIIRKKIYFRELVNIKTGQKKDSEMRADIKKIIEKEVRKCY